VSDRPTCIVADDHPLMRESLSGLLSENGIAVVGCAADGDEALALITMHRPHVAVVDLHMPKRGGADVVREAARLAPQTSAVILTAFGEHADLVQALDAGARGFVLKDAPLAEVLRAVRMAIEGRIYIDPSLAESIAGGRRDQSAPVLTPRQREVVRLLASGLRTEDIAKVLYIAPDTVRVHIRNALRGLNADTRAHAVATALRRALIR
jgi:DNA-binding NarL/FixJ family response regulator